MPIEGCTLITIEICSVRRIAYTATSLRTLHRATSRWIMYELPLHADCLKASRDGREDVSGCSEGINLVAKASRPKSFNFLWCRLVRASGPTNTRL